MILEPKVDLYTIAITRHEIAMDVGMISLLKAGDVESNPGPQNRKLPPSALTTQTTTLNSTTHSHATTSHPNQKLLTLLQLNINSITNKHEELKLLVTELQPDIITIQETKLKKHNKTPQIPTYSAIRTDRANGK